jgi:hypothetical protein
MTSERTVLAQLAELDPTRHEPLAGQDQVDATLRWVLAQERAEPVAEIAHPRRRRAALASAAATLVLGLAGASILPGVLSGTGSTAPASATVPMLTYSEPAGTTGNAELTELADTVRSAAAAEPAPAAGPYRYIRHEGERWSFTLMPDGSMRPDATMIQTERWVAADGSARLLQTDDGRTPYGYDDFAPDQPEPPLDLTGSPQEIVRRLADGAPAEDAASAVLGAYVSTIGLYGQYTAEERAAFLDALATLDVTSYGLVEDRAGRTGIAFGTTRHVDDLRVTHPELGPSPGREHEQPPLDLDGHVEQIRVILDPDTGELLATESITAGTDYLPMETVTGYNLFLDDTYVDALPECGAIGCRADDPADPGVAATPEAKPLTGSDGVLFQQLAEGSGFQLGQLLQPLPDGPAIEGSLTNPETGTEITFTYRKETTGGLHAALLADHEYQAFDLSPGLGFIHRTGHTVNLRGQERDGTRTAVVTVHAPGADMLPDADVAFAKDVFLPGLIRGTAE